MVRLGKISGLTPLNVILTWPILLRFQGYAPHTQQYNTTMLAYIYTKNQNENNT